MDITIGIKQYGLVSSFGQYIHQTNYYSLFDRLSGTLEVYFTKYDRINLVKTKDKSLQPIVKAVADYLNRRYPNRVTFVNDNYDLVISLGDGQREKVPVIALELKPYLPFL